MTNHCGTCFHSWASRAKSGVSKACPKCKSKDVRVGEWRAATTPTGPQLNVAPAYLPPGYGHAWSPPYARRTASGGIWIAIAVIAGVGVLFLSVCGAIVGSANKSATNAASLPTATVPPATAATASVETAPPVAKTPAVSTPKPTSTATPAAKATPPLNAPVVTGCAAFGTSTCGDGSCGCYGRGCCSHHGGIAH